MYVLLKVHKKWLILVNRFPETSFQVHGSMHLAFWLLLQGVVHF